MLHHLDTMCACNSIDYVEAEADDKFLCVSDVTINFALFIWTPGGLSYTVWVRCALEMMLWLVASTMHPFKTNRACFKVF